MILFESELILEKTILPEKIKKIIRRPRFRKKLLERCGSKAFLLPEELKFPVMTTKCQYHCGLIFAAYIRANQWGYEDIAKKAMKLYEENNCAAKLGLHIRKEEK